MMSIAAKDWICKLVYIALQALQQIRTVSIKNLCVPAFVLVSKGISGQIARRGA